jgi:Raf kinase inhibitor-like YbhB/YbcL family protein
MRALLVVLLFAAPAAAFSLESRAFQAGESIPAEHTCDGADRSPPLAWADPPPGTAAFALVCTDPDAPSGHFVHWLAWNVPGTATGLDGARPTTPTLADGSRQGRNDFRRTGWGGPCPPKGPPHRYVFELLALDTPLELPADAGEADLRRAATGHVRGTARLVGRYARR